MNYSVQFAAPAAAKRRLHVSAPKRAMAWAMLLRQFLAAHPGRLPVTVTVLEVSAWQAARR